MRQKDLIYWIKHRGLAYFTSWREFTDFSGWVLQASLTLKVIHRGWFIELEIVLINVIDERACLRK